MLDKLLQAIQTVLPPELAADVQQNVDAVVRRQFEKMHLVSQEQFEIQQKMLERTRIRINELEQRIDELEGSRASGTPRPTEPSLGENAN